MFFEVDWFTASSEQLNAYCLLLFTYARTLSSEVRAIRYCFMASAVLVSSKSTQKREAVVKFQPVLSGNLLFAGFESETCTYSTKPACDGNTAQATNIAARTRPSRFRQSAS